MYYNLALRAAPQVQALEGEADRRAQPPAIQYHFSRISHMTVSTRWPKPKCTIPAWPRPKENCGLLALDHLKDILNVIGSHTAAIQYHYDHYHYDYYHVICYVYHYHYYLSSSLSLVVVVVVVVVILILVFALLSLFLLLAVVVWPACSASGATLSFKGN